MDSAREIGLDITYNQLESRLARVLLRLSESVDVHDSIYFVILMTLVASYRIIRSRSLPENMRAIGLWKQLLR